jgi:hypothetical protein
LHIHTYKTHHTERRAQGIVTFFAPKSVGNFVLRVFDEADPVETLATSPPWVVGAQGRDVESSARFAVSQLRAGAAAEGRGVVGALVQLAHVLHHLRELPPPRYMKFAVQAVWNAVTAAHGQLAIAGPPAVEGGADDHRIRYY